MDLRDELIQKIKESDIFISDTALKTMSISQLKEIIEYDIDN
jgi:hypothetical protein